MCKQLNTASIHYRYKDYANTKQAATAQHHRTDVSVRNKCWLCSCYISETFDLELWHWRI